MILTTTTPFLLLLVLAPLGKTSPDPAIETAIRQTLMSLTPECQTQFSVCGDKFADDLRQQGKYCEAVKKIETCMKTPTVYNFITGICNDYEYKAIEATACQLPTPNPGSPDNSQTTQLWTDFGKIVMDVVPQCQGRVADCLNYTGNDFSNDLSTINNVGDLFDLSSPPATKTELCHVLLDAQPCLEMEVNGIKCQHEETYEMLKYACMIGG